MVIKQLALLFVCILVLQAGPSNAGTFFQWTDANGSVGSTDDIERVPERYRAQAVSRKFKDLKDRTTPMNLESSVYQESLEARSSRAQTVRVDPRAANPNELRDCTGPVFISQERVSHRERGKQLNSLFYMVRNACGDLVSVTREQPRLEIRPSTD